MAARGASPPSSLYAASFTLPTAATNTALTERRDAERKARIASRKKAARFLGKLVKTGMTALSSSLAQARQPEPQTPSLEDYQFTRGLKVDGIMNKGGETERALTLDLRQNYIPDDPGQDDPEEPEVDCEQLARDVENARLAVENAERALASEKEKLSQAQKEFDERQKEYYQKLLTLGISDIFADDKSIRQKALKAAGKANLLATLNDIRRARAAMVEADKKRRDIEPAVKSAEKTLAELLADWKLQRFEYDRYCR